MQVENTTNRHPDLHEEQQTGAGLEPTLKPLFVLGPPRSFTSLVGAVLGQHPQMYGLPETHAFNAETVAEWLDLCGRTTFNMAHGLLRAVAQLCFDSQTEATIKLAEGWLRRRAHFTTGYLFEVLSEKVYPRILVDNSPSIIFHIECLQRVRGMFPHSGFIHVVQHPRGFCESVMESVNSAAEGGSVPQWLRDLARFPDDTDAVPVSGDQTPDPQVGWFTLNKNIERFLETVPEEQKLQVRGEDLLADPDPALRRISAWMGLRDDDAAIDEMKHPERSPYACFGPANARYGNDPHFLENPALPAMPHGAMAGLDEPLSWRTDGGEFLPKVKQLARSFGYE